MTTTGIENSSFWMGQDSLKRTLGQPDTLRLMELISCRRAVANFVSILTEKNIPVRFITNSSEDAYTDKKSVTISADVTGDDIDYTVGLALHEASHILLSDFELKQNIPQLAATNRLHKLGLIKNLTRREVVEELKFLTNVIEDRRVDDFVYRKAPGYRGYYSVLYNKFFNGPRVEVSLKAGYDDKDLRSYTARVSNMFSKFSDPDILPNLRKIFGMVDLENISRLNNSRDSFDLASEIMAVILESIDEKKPAPPAMPQPTTGPKPDGKPTQGEGPAASARDEDDDEDEDDQDNFDDDNSLSENEDDLDGEDEEDTEPDDAAIQEQRDFINGELDKDKIDKDLLEEMKILENGEAEVKDVAGDDSLKLEPIKCIVIKKMTKDTLKFFESSPEFRTNMSPKQYETTELAVAKGINLGKILGSKLKVRGEVRDTKYSRQKCGKLDKRLVAELGYNDGAVFYTTEISHYKRVFLHISVDASGSMSEGRKWESAVTSAVSIAQAAKTLHNLDVMISFRYAHHFGATGKVIPLVLIAYDSRKDNMAKIKSLFKFLVPTGYTPEGLAFEAIMNFIPPSDNDCDSIFLNLSDGEPFIQSENIEYVGAPACMHTQKQVRKMAGGRVEVISYFVETSRLHGGKQREQFLKMYGRKNSCFINPESMDDIARTLNKKFLENKLVQMG